MKVPNVLTAFAQFTARLRRPAGAWTISDLIDFESYLAEDEAQLREQPAARKQLAERDRVLFIEQIAPDLVPAQVQPHTSAHRRLSVRRWLTARRDQEDPQVTPLLPGAAFETAQRLSTVALAGGGLFLGMGLAAALLSYDGHLPISVPAYIFWLVVVQIVFILTASWAWLRQSLRRETEVGTDHGLLTLVLRPLLTQVAQWFQRQRLTEATADIRERALARQGLTQAQFTIYGSVAYFPLLIPAQVFGVAFNVGVIATTLVLEWFTDLAFGWSTSLIAHPQTIHDLTHALALPWSWIFGEGVGYPTLAQIEGSRIYLEQWANVTPTFHPDPEHLRSWRWFLVLAVFTYGLLPRLILLSLSVLMQRLALARLTFTHGRIQALYARLLTPLVETTPTVMVPGVEMPIPAPLTPHSRRAGLIGPLAGEKPVPSVRPWREKIPPSPPFSKGGDESAPFSSIPPAPPLPKGGDKSVLPLPPAAVQPPLTKDVNKPLFKKKPPDIPAEPAPIIEPEPIVESAPVIEPEPIVESAPVIEPEAIVESVPVIEPEPIVDAIKPPLEKGGLGGFESAPVIEPKPIVESAPVIEPEPIVESVPVIEPEPIVESAPVIEPEPIVESAPVIEPEPIVETAPVIEPEPIVDAVKPPLEKGGLGGFESAPVIEPEPIVDAVKPPLEKGGLGGFEFAPDACLVLVHVDVDDVLEPEDRPRLEQLLLQLTGWRCGAYATVGAGSAMTMKALELLDGGIWDAPPPRIALIQDGSQPPITENLLLLRDLRAAAGTQAQMLLALVGDPQDDDRLPPLRAFDYTDWQRKIDQMADPYLRLEMLAPTGMDGEI
jgi:hypothetical protein